MEKDPLCGMDVDPSSTNHTSECNGKTYYFCAPGCKKAFEAEPQKYLDPKYQGAYVSDGPP
jgi:YHS domain-containing protein